jgi:hypothetical protein
VKVFVRCGNRLRPHLQDVAVEDGDGVITRNVGKLSCPDSALKKKISLHSVAAVASRLVVLLICLATLLVGGTGWRPVIS